VTSAPFCFTSPADGRPCSPHDHARSVPQKGALVTSGIRVMPNVGELPPAVRRRSFRSGCIPASLRLRSTFPFAEPQAEALQKSICTGAPQWLTREFNFVYFSLCKSKA
jgi:hypothetical protein